MRYYAFLLIPCALLFSCGTKTTFEIVSDEYGGADKDLGEQFLGDSLNIGFVVKNTGEENLLITEVEPDCSCTVGTYTKDPIKPGEIGNITLQYDVVIPDHEFKKKAKVYANVDGGSFDISFSGYQGDINKEKNESKDE